MTDLRGQDDFREKPALYRKLFNLSASGGERLSLDTLFLRKKGTKESFPKPATAQQRKPTADEYDGFN
jgi:hypothetical protein